MSSRHCTLLKIPYFRDWFERRYGGLCRAHDIDYYLAFGKLAADVRLFKGIARKGRWYDLPLAVGTIIAVQLPWVWIEYIYKKGTR